MACEGLSTKYIMNLLFGSGGHQGDDLEDSEEDIIHQMMMGKYNLLSDNRGSNEDDNRDENMFEPNPTLVILEQIFSHLEINLKLGRVKQPIHQRVVLVVIML